jgi:hypothetical protein
MDNNLKQVLCAFEKLYGLKINFHKSELFFFGKTKDKVDQYVGLFGCKVGLFGCKGGVMSFRYPGIPMSHKRISTKG